jgi:hypothetical protein
MSRWFITSPRAIDEGPSTMKLASVDESGWYRTYRDTQGLFWTHYYPYQDDRSSPHLMRADLPKPVVALFRQVLGSGDDEDLAGLGAYMSSADVSIDEVLEALHQTISEHPPPKWKRLGASFRPRDNRKIIGMTVDQITESYLRWRRCVDEVTRLLN